MKCKSCSAKDEHIATLKEQIDWLRTHQGTPSLTAQNQQARQTTEVSYDPTQQWYSEEEEEVEAMKQAGLIDLTEAEKALEQLGAINTEIYVEG